MAGENLTNLNHLELTALSCQADYNRLISQLAEAVETAIQEIYPDPIIGYYTFKADSWQLDGETGLYYILMGSPDDFTPEHWGDIKMDFDTDVVTAGSLSAPVQPQYSGGLLSAVTSALPKTDIAVQYTLTRVRTKE